MTVPAKTTYAALLKAIRAEIALARGIIQRQEATSYWKIGRWISYYILHGRDRAKYGAGLYQSLARDLHLSVNTLERAVRFSREYPISAAPQKLTWSHFNELMRVRDPDKRKELERRAEAQNLNTRQLRAAIARYNAAIKLKPTALPAATKPLPVNPARLYTYRIIYPTAGTELRQAPYIDCGFNVWKDLPEGSQEFTQDAPVTAVKEKNGYMLQPAPAGVGEKHLYTFKAYLEKIIDGDTIWLNIDLGFGIMTRQKVRFNGIDTPEIDTPLGRKAKRFVERALKGLDSFIVKTYKSDKYDRYLTDVFYKGGKSAGLPVAGQPTPEGKASDLAGLAYLNQELLDAGMAWRMDK